jgi:signal peptidase I
MSRLHDLVGAVAVVTALAFAAVACGGSSGAVREWVMEGVSMDPNVCAGDRLRFDSPNDAVERWSIILFRVPFDEERRFIKRAVGLPGEEVSVRNGFVVIDGEQIVGDKYARDPANYEWGPKVVPDNHYFVLGDNRRNSFDSHVWPTGYEFVPRANIEGVLPPDTSTCPGRRQE